MKYIGVALLLMYSCVVNAQQITINNLTCENKTNPLGIDAVAPKLSWIINSDQRDVLQTGYQIIVADNLPAINKNQGNVWDSRKVNSDQSIMLPYGGKELQSAKTYYWKARVWDNKNAVAVWSAVASWQMGLLSATDWKGAKWIAYDELPPAQRIVPAIHGNGPKNLGPGKDILPLMRKNFKVSKIIKKASLFISGLGHFEASLNGKTIGDHFLDPGWTSYDKEAMYVSFDITKQLKPGLNAIGVMLGNGMYYIPRERYRKITGAFGYPKMICLVKLEYSDGSMENVISDESWKTTAGPITFSSIYGGENYDARLEKTGWNTANFNDSAWKRALIVNGSPHLKAQIADPVKVMDTLTTKKITHPNDNTWVYDLGQNSSAIPQLKIKGSKNSTIKIIPGELLDDKGLVTQQATGAPNYFAYTLKGGAVETWQPKFSYYGFRYLQITGAKPQKQAGASKLPEVIELRGLHIRNSSAKTGDFYCSNQLFNRTYTLINWAVKSNMVSVLTDCPHREKLGWLEEAHLMANSIRYNFDINNLFLQEIENIRTSQRENGMIPDIAPEYVQFDGGFVDSPEWGSTGVILPWYLYQWYGNKDVLVQNYGMIKRYVEYLKSKANNDILDYGLGDWFDIGPKNPGQAQLTPKSLTATAYYFYDLSILTRIAKITGNEADAVHYGELAARVRSNYNKVFFNTSTNQYSTGSQTANAISVYMGLVEPQYKKAVVDNIVKDLQAHNNAITAGDIGFRYLLKVLADEGRSDVIFAMNSRDDVPGYGYQLAHGATSLTESWQAYRFVSNNHFMLGHLMEWFYNNLAGIGQSEDIIASKEIVIHPSVVGDVTYARGSFKSPYGVISSSWQNSKSEFKLQVRIPANTKAVVYFPDLATEPVYEVGKAQKVLSTVNIDGHRTLEIGSGMYSFSIKK